MSLYTVDLNPKLRFGIVTDSHYADVDTKLGRYYRQSLSKMEECVNLMRRQQVDFLIELGDLKDQDNTLDEELTISYLRAIERVFQNGAENIYHVLGNHDVDSISKSQFLSVITNTGIPLQDTFYAYCLGDLQFIVLDANYREDGVEYDHGNFDWVDTNVPASQLDWLRQKLHASPFPSVIFVHQLLDGEGNHYINNAAEVRQILENSEKVLAVFQGHQHDGQYNIINGIHYYTLPAVVEGSGRENSAYAIVEIYHDNSIAVIGYHKAPSKLFCR